MLESYKQGKVRRQSTSERVMIIASLQSFSVIQRGLAYKSENELFLNICLKSSFLEKALHLKTTTTTSLKNRRLVRACDYCGDIQVKNMEIEHLRNILLEVAPYMKKYEN